MIGIYFFLLRLGALLGHAKAKKMCQGQKHLLQNLSNWISHLPPNSKIVWFHVASVGEFEQARPIIEKSKKLQPDVVILLTFFSPSGYELRKKYDNADHVAYLPYATKKNARRFVQIVHPHLAVFVKYEFWPHYLKILKKNAIPTFLISAIFNKNQFFFNPLGFAYRKLLTCFTHLYVQDNASQQLLSKYGFENVSVTGDTRFDRVLEVKKIAAKNKIVETFLNTTNPYNELSHLHNNVIVAGSVYEKDEFLIAQYLSEHPLTKIILVPHEITKQHLHSIFQIFQGRVVFYTNASEKNVLHTNVLVVDVVGLLSSLYQYADVAYIGGGFNKGIHNTIEAAVYGIPVIFGPKHKKFREATDLIKNNAAFDIYNYESLKKAINDSLNNKETMGHNAIAYTLQEKGASDKIYNELFNCNEQCKI